MESRTRSTSDYASAYKLTSSSMGSGDRRALRMQRRSLDWKNLRGEEVNKRRKLKDLSPLQEQQRGEKSYNKGVTPVRPVVSKNKGSDPKPKGAASRKDMMLKWKEEREKKRKEEHGKKKQLPTFKVTQVKYSEAEQLYGQRKKAEPNNTKIPPSTEKALKQINSQSSRPSKSSRNILNPVKPTGDRPVKSSGRSMQHEARAQPKPVSKSSRSVALGTTCPSAGGRVTRQSSRIAQSGSAAKPVKTQTRNPLFKNTERTASAKKKPGLTVVTSSSSQNGLNDYDLNLEKVATFRGESFAPVDFSFNAPENLTSFVFKPLSPRSAAGFLHPTQDMTLTASFLGPAPPRRCSTPKPPLESSKPSCPPSAEVATAITEAESSTDNSEPENTGKDAEDKPTVTSEESSKPQICDTRAVRRSTRAISEVDEANSLSQITQTTSEQGGSQSSDSEANSLRVTKSLQKSNRRTETSQVTMDTDRSQSSDSDTNSLPVSRSLRKSSRKSLHVETNKENSQTGEIELDTPSRNRSTRQSTRRSLAVFSDTEQTIAKFSESDKKSPLKSNLEEKTTTTMEEEVNNTPSYRGGNSRRKSTRRKSHAIDEEGNMSIKQTKLDVLESNTVAEIEETVVSKEDVLEREHNADIENLQTMQLSDSISKTPRRSLRRSVRRSLAIDSFEHSAIKNDSILRSEVAEHTKLDVTREMQVDVESTRKTSSEPLHDLSRTDTPMEEDEAPAIPGDVCYGDDLEKQMDEEKTVKSDGSKTPPKTNSPTQQREEMLKATPGNRVYKTPSRSTRSARRTMSAAEEFMLPTDDSIVMSSKRSTKRMRRKTEHSTPGPVKSPEEWVKILRQSPMIEMTRRTPKVKTPPGCIPPAALDFEDLDETLSLLSRSDPSTSNTQEPSSTHSEESVTLAEHDQIGDQMDSDASALTGPCPDDTAPCVINSVQSDMPCTGGMPPVDIQSSCLMGVETAVPDSTTDAVISSESSSSAAQKKETSSSGQAVSSPVDSDVVTSSEGDHDILYFRNLLVSETQRLKTLISRWHETNSIQISEEDQGQIRTVTGKAQLLIDQRFKQFSGLVDNCEFGTGEKETTCMDLQGFWEMIYFQVEDVDSKFQELQNMEANNWVKEKPSEPVKKIKKKIVKQAASKPAVKSKFAAFRAQMQTEKQKQQKCEDKVFDAGFFKVSSPTRSPKPHCAAGSPSKPPNPLPVSSHTPTAPTSSVTPLDSSSMLTPKPESSTNISTTALPPSESAPVVPVVPVAQPHVVPTVIKTPVRRSYVPAVPSPLLQDITPLAGRKRKSIQKTPVPAKMMRTNSEEVVNSKENTPSVDLVARETIQESPDKQAKSAQRSKRKSVRRSLRARKSVCFAEDVETFSDEGSNSSNEDSFSKYLQPSSSINMATENRPADNSFSKYLQSNSMTLDTSLTADTEETDGRFENLRVDFTPVSKSSRPSLLFTPEKSPASPVIQEVPTGKLISFSPS